MTWQIDIRQKARQVKLLPRATTRERASLPITDLEVYGAQRVDEMEAKVFAADINGDGSNELVVGTSEKEVAAYDAQGKQLWQRTYPGEILAMDTADLEENGKAETLVYLMTEQLHRVNGDGTERPGGDVYQAQVKAFNGCSGVAGGPSLAVWGPDGAAKKEVLLFSEVPFSVRADGSVGILKRGMNYPHGSGRLVNLYPNEPEVLVLVIGRWVDLWSAHRDKDGNYVKLGSAPEVAGPDGGKLGWMQQVNVPGFKGFLAAYQGGINYYPIVAFDPKSKEHGWEFSSGGVPAVAAMTADINGNGVPEVFMARLDGFVNVLKLARLSHLAGKTSVSP